MSSIFYPILPFSCPWGAHGSCKFCGIPFMEKVLISELPTHQDILMQFENFIKEPKNMKDIERRQRVAIAPNGSVVPEVPKIQRDQILRFCHEYGVQFESEIIATLISPEKTYRMYDKAYRVRFRNLTDNERHKKVCETLEEIECTLNHDFKGRNVLLNTGLEVADSDDLKTLHKYTTNLNDYVLYADYLRARNIFVGANVLIGAPIIKDPVKKSLLTIRFAFNEMGADKILLIVWNPVKRTVAKNLYDCGEIDVLSATQSAEIYKIAREIYPEKKIEYNQMRSHVYHGKHQNFRPDRINTDKRKQKAREEVRRIADQIFI